MSSNPRNRFLAATVAVACGCGNYSNDDIAFLNALPHHEDLQVNVPGTSTSQSPLDSVDAGCTPQLGTTSCFFTGTRTASETFNGFIFFLLDGVDFVRQLPPTERTPDARVWGPYALPDQPGFDVEVTISRTPPIDYAYRVAFLHGADPATAFTFLQGTFSATGGARKGSGGFQVNTAGAFAQGVDGGQSAPFSSMDVSYRTDTDPISVSMLAFAGNDAGTLAYSYRGYASDAGALFFDLSAGQELLLHSAWLGDGSGRGDALVTSGPYAGAAETDCWGRLPLSLTTYLFQAWPGGADGGDAGSCVDVANL